MKNLVKTLALILLLVLKVNAQSSKITGSWLLTKVVLENEEKQIYQVTEFKPSGKLVIMEREVGAWEVNKTMDKITFKSERYKDFNGDAKIVSLTKKALVFLKGDTRYYYQKINKEQVIKDNKQSNFVGVWKVKNTESIAQIVKFELPDSYTFIHVISNEETDTSNGTWMYYPKEKELVIIGFLRELKGTYKVLEKTKEKLVLSKDNKKFVLVKEVVEAVERLTFEYEDFSEEPLEEPNLPWGDNQAMIEALNPIKSLEFKRHVLLPDVNTFRYQTEVSKIKVNRDKQSVKFINYVISKTDTIQFSENYKGGLSERYNRFFPKKEPFPYSVKGVEKVTVPAGTFKCTVIEGFDVETKIKYYMINNLPGVFAKIIREERDPFDKLSYTIQELVKINKTKD